MGKTNFNIVFVDNVDNCEQIAFTDLTEYNEDVEIKTPILKILYPDFTIPETLTYVPYTTNVIKVPTGDGLYTIEISVCPNDKVKKVFYYFKVCEVMNQIKQKLCQNSSNLQKVNELMDIFKYTIVTQLIVNESPEKATIMYQYVKSKINC